MEGKRGSSPQHLETSALTSLASLWVLAKPPSSPAHSGSGMERRGRPAPLFTLIRRRQEGEGAIFSFRTPRWGAQVQSGRGAGCTWAANPGSHPDWRRNTIAPLLCWEQRQPPPPPQHRGPEQRGPDPASITQGCLLRGWDRSGLYPAHWSACRCVHGGPRATCSTVASSAVSHLMQSPAQGSCGCDHQPYSRSCHHWLSDS